LIENFKLHVFRVIADTLNFSKAAEELHLTQPAIVKFSLQRDPPYIAISTAVFLIVIYSLVRGGR
jgi:hypothetical protein